jgi:cytochrome c-type biogenesis protein CcmH
MFIPVCIGLVLLSGLFYLIPPRVRPTGTVKRSELNLALYRLRQQELEDSGESELLQDMKLRLIEDVATADSAVNAVESGSFPSWALLPVVAFASFALYYKMGAAPDVEISRQLKALDQQSSPEQMQTLMQTLETRSSQRPDNLHYRALLGRFYMNQNDYPRAAQTYTALALEAPDEQMLAYAAQAQYLADDRRLSDAAKMLAEQALSLNPHQRTALGLLGMASFEQGQYRAAISYWERLIATEPQDSESALLVLGIIERAKMKLGETGASVAEAVPARQPAALESVGVSVRVSVPQGGKVSDSSTVFVLARAANSDSRMPIAVARLQGSDLPIVLRLDDSNSMAGQKLSETESIIVAVQVSPDGRPGEANASWLGNAGPLAPSLDQQPLEIELRPVD